MASRKTKSVIISNPLFTPYGYKFEKIGNENKIYSWYEYTRIKPANKEPWKFTAGGVIGVNTDEITRLVGVSGGYWNNSARLVNFGYAYHSWINDSSIFPAAWDQCSWGLSVH